MNCTPTNNVYAGDSSKGPEKDYSVKGDTENRVFGIFNAVAIIATTYGNGIIPEIQVSNSSIPIFFLSTIVPTFQIEDVSSIQRVSMLHTDTYSYKFALALQATLAPPVKGKMFKGLSICYAIVTVTFSTVAISGYWAFGNESEGLILSNFLDNGKPLVPKWFIFMANIFTIVQLSAVGAVSNTNSPLVSIVYSINVYHISVYAGLLATYK